MYKISVNDTHTFEIEREKNQVRINGELLQWDVQPVNENVFHIICRARSYTVEIVRADYTAKSFVLKVNGQTYRLQASNEFDLLLEKLGMSASQTTQITEIKAPMPGLILSVPVTEGQTVQKGDVLVILEAMKMENVIKSPTDGTVKTIKVTKGESVEKNQVLVSF